MHKKLFSICGKIKLTVHMAFNYYYCFYVSLDLPKCLPISLSIFLSDHFSTSLRSSFGLPWWRSGWESACQCRGHGFEPWSGKIPHAAGWLGPWPTIAEPACLEPVLRNKRGHYSERPAHRDEAWPPLAATRERPRTETKTQHSHKWMNK